MMHKGLANGMRAVSETLVEDGGGLFVYGFKKVKCYPLAKASMPTITTTIDSSSNTYIINYQTVHRQSQNIIAEKRELELSIRKLTEREVFRFMDVDEEGIDKIFAAVPAKSQRYALAGNSIVVGVLYNIFEKMFVQTKPDSNTQLELNFDN